APLKVDKDASISGTPEVGKTLTGTPAEISDSGADVVNQWLADGEPIDGANGKKLTLTKQMLGKKITFKSTATRDGDEPVSSVSEAVTVVEAGSGKEDGPSEPGKGVKDKQDEISVLPSTTLHPGQDFAVEVGDDWAGEKVSIWMFSEKFDLGTHTVGKNGRVSVTVPEDISLGAHKVAAYDADGDLIGWVNVKVVAEQAAGPGTSAGGVAGALPGTGAEWLTNVLAPAGVLLRWAGGGRVLAAVRVSGGWLARCRAPVRHGWRTCWRRQVCCCSWREEVRCWSPGVAATPEPERRLWGTVLNVVPCPRSLFWGCFGRFGPL